MTNSWGWILRVFGHVAARLILGCIMALCGFTMNGYCQGITGSITGVVLDPAGAVIGNVPVTATNQATGVTQTVNTSSSGGYVFPSLLPGNYAVTVEVAGFQKLSKRDVVVRANFETPVNLPLTVGTVTQTVEVAAGSVAVETTTSTLSTNFDSRDILELPNAGGALNGSPLNLAILAPNVTPQPGGVSGIGGSVGGTRPRFNSFSVDGVDDNNTGVTGNLATVIPDAVSEFQLITNHFSAEYSHSAGGIFNLTTKIGTNDLHGEGYGYFQNRNLNALGSTDHQSIAGGLQNGALPFDDDRFGGNIGAPLIRDRWFIFGAYEYTDLHGVGSPVTVTTFTPAGLAALVSMPVDASVAHQLAIWPTAPVGNGTTVTVNGVAIPLGTDVITAPILQREHDVQVNTDFTAGHHQLAGRFLLNQANFLSAATTTPQPIFNQSQPYRTRKLQASDIWSSGGRFLNELRGSFSYYLLQNINSSAATTYADITLLDLGGGIQTGPSDPQSNKQDTYQLLDNVTYTRGQHSVKFGAEYLHIIAPSSFLSRGFGDNWYSNTQQFVNDLVPDVTSRTLRNVGNPTFNGTKSSFQWFVQDDFKIRPRLTLNAGLRYEYWTNAAGQADQALNAISNVPGVITFGVPKTDKNNFGPRIGLAWDPFGNSKWAIRSGFGIAYDVKFDNFSSISRPAQRQAELNEAASCALPAPPAWCATNSGFLDAGGLPAVFQPPTTALQARNLTTSYIGDTVLPKVMNWTLSVQHELYRNGVFEVRYLGTRGLSLPIQSRLNFTTAFDAGIPPLPTYFNMSQVPTQVDLATVPTDTPINNFQPNLYLTYGFRGNITANPPFGSSTYHGLSASFTHRAHSLTFNTNYTYAHALDSGTNEFNTSALNPRRAQDSNRLRDDWASSDLDLRHKFVLTTIYQLPNVPSENNLLKYLGNGYQVSGVFLAQSGQPITIQSGAAGIDSNVNGDTAGDRAVLNSSVHNNLGSDIFPVCATASTGVTYVSTANGGIATGTGACNAGDPAIGYLAVNPRARYVLAGPGARANLGRNSFLAPGAETLNMSLVKNTYFTESKYLQLRADFYNVLNHSNYSLSNGSVFSVAGEAVALGSGAFANPVAGDGVFLNPKLFFPTSPRTITLGIKLIF